MNRLSDTRACVFDAYGTLFDVHSAIGRYRARIGSEADALSALWRQKQLEYSWLRSLMGDYIPFWQITQDALDYALHRFGLDDGELRDSLVNAYLELQAYPEVDGVLRELRQQGRRLAILSNGSPEMLEAAVNGAQMGPHLEAVLSVDELRIFKPDPRVYQLACDRLGLDPHQIVFLSSNAWDAAGAASFGFRVVWINRFAQPWEYLPGAPEAEIRTLDELPPLLE